MTLNAHNLAVDGGLRIEHPALGTLRLGRSVAKSFDDDREVEPLGKPAARLDHLLPHVDWPTRDPRGELAVRCRSEGCLLAGPVGVAEFDLSRGREAYFPG